METVITLLPIIVFFVLLVYGVEIAYSLAISGLMGLFIVIGYGPTGGLLETVPYRTVASYTLTTIPMFILMAEFATRSGIIKQLFDLCDSLFGHVRNGLAFAVLLASALMGALSGSSVGATGAMARMAVPEMERRGYSDRLSLGIIATAGTLAVMIPPSIPLVIYGVMTETSVGALLMAGVIPGVLTGSFYFILLLFWGRFRQQDLPQQSIGRSSWNERWEALKPTWPFVLILFVVIGGIYTGTMTATEAAATGAFATLITWLGLAVLYRKSGRNAFNLREMGVAFDNTIRTTVMIMLLIVGANFLGYYLTVTGYTQAFGEFMVNMSASRYVVLAMIVGLYVGLGLFLSQTTTLILTLPIIFPIIVALDFNPIWFGVLVTKTVEIGLVTPPVGMNAYIASGAVPGKKAGDAFAGAAPFLIADVGVIILITVFPALVLSIPEFADLT